MSYHGRISARPDVRYLERQYLRALWTYVQGASATRLDDGRIVLALNGGGVVPDLAGQSQRYAAGLVDSPLPPYGVPAGQLPEEVWAIEYPRPDPLLGGRPERYWDLARWHRLLDLGSADHESFGPSLIRTPASWSDDRRWLMVYTGTTYATLGKRADRQYIALGWARDVLGPWQHRQEAIPPRRVLAAPPAGIWGIAALVLGSRVLVIGYDASIPGRELHEVYELQPDLSARRLARLVTGAPYPWFVDFALDAQGRLLALTGITPHDDVDEWASEGPWDPDAETHMAPTGRTWPSLSVPGQPLPLGWDGSYLRDPEGRIAGDAVIACEGASADPWTPGNWRLQYWTDDVALAGQLGVEVERVKLGLIGKESR